MALPAPMSDFPRKKVFPVSSVLLMPGFCCALASLPTFDLVLSRYFSP
jgi:hypothetical protein